MQNSKGWWVCFFGKTFEKHLGPVDTLREAYMSAWCCQYPNDKRNPLVYYGTKRVKKEE